MLVSKQHVRRSEGAHGSHGDAGGRRAGDEDEHGQGRKGAFDPDLLAELVVPR